MKQSLVPVLLCAAFALPAQAQSVDPQSSISASDMDRAAARAEATVAQMGPAEKVRLTWGEMPLPLGPDQGSPPDGSLPAAGFVRGVPRLGIPNLLETDGPLGVSYVMGLRGDFATAFPSGISLGSTFDPEFLYEVGDVIGQEARAKGFNVVLAGGANLMRDPRNGRTFEYLSEDPLLTGALVGANIAGVQSNNVISTIKHFALNGQETGRKFVDVQIGDASARESDLLAFQIGIERGQPGSVMCAYNRVNSEQGCASDYLLNQVLKRDWGYKGFVMSDWGAVPGLHAAINGLDQQSGAQLDADVFFDETLLEAAQSGAAYAARLDDMNKRILTAVYAAGLDRRPVTAGGVIDFEAHAAIAQEAAEKGIVLLKNEGGILPLAKAAGSIAVIGGYADTGVLSGGGSSQVHSEGGPAVTVPISGQGLWASFIAPQYHRSAPLDAIRARMPEGSVKYRDGRYITDAVAQARKADLAIVFAAQWMTEGLDVPDLSLPQGQDALIAAVAEANPNTIVVLETGGPVDMPWLSKVKGVVQAWYPGMRGGEAIARVLYGEVNPAGHLPVTFPKAVADLPRTEIPGMDIYDPDFSGAPPTAEERLTTDYRIEGSDLGYRWNARKGLSALFPFGHGLSYTSFAHEGLDIDGTTARLTIRNSGDRAGADVGQVYLLARNGSPVQRLVAFGRVELEPGEAREIVLPLDRRLIAEWQHGEWVLPDGTYRFGLGTDAETIVETVDVRLGPLSWRD